MDDNSGNPKLEWMYKTGQDLLNREEYLTGRKVDKQFEELTSTENCVEHEVLPASISRKKNLFENHEQVDIIRKQMEDPLMAIKQKEMEARRKILENPVKLKELHRLLKKEKNDHESSGKSSTKTTSQKSKKHKKSRSSSSSSSSSSGSEDLDKLLLEKYKNIKEAKNDSDTDANFIEKKFKTLTKELDKIVNKKSKKRSSSRESDNDRRGKRDSRASPARNQDRRRRDSPERRHNEKTSHKRRSMSPDKRRDQRRRSRSIERRRESPRRKLSKDPEKKIQPSSRRRSRSLDKRVQPSSRRRSRSVDKRRGSPRRQRSRSGDRRKVSRSPRRNRRESPNQPKAKKEDSKYRNPSPPKQKAKSQQKDDSSSDETPPPQPQSRNRQFEDSDEERRHNKPRNYGLVTASGEKIALERKEEVKRYTREELKPVREAPKKQEVKRKKPLTEEEMNAIRDEMMQNADWREKDRSKTVKKHRDSEEREKKSHVQQFDKGFLDRHMKKAQDQIGSVESRIKSNLNNIQRSGRTMDSNFAKR